MTESLERRLAGVLSELEDAEVDLTNKEARLAKDLAEVQDELERLQQVKAVIHRKPKPALWGSESAQRRERIEKVKAWIAALDNGRTFTGRELAESVDGVTTQGIGPVLAGLMRHGVVTETGTNKAGRKTYQRA